MAGQNPKAADMSANEQELQRSSREFLGELERINEMEARKREMAERDEKRLALAHEIEDATISLVGLGRYQTRLIEMDQQSLGEPVPSRRTPHEILDEWRSAERDLRDARSALEQATDAADRLRAEHQRSLSSRLE